MQEMTVDNSIYVFIEQTTRNSYLLEKYQPFLAVIKEPIGQTLIPCLQPMEE
jgi:hypothetical protein